MGIFWKFSKILQPKLFIPPGKERGAHLLSNSQKLLQNLGFVSPSRTPGAFILLPLAIRVQRKLRKIIEDELQQIGAQEVLLPSLVTEDLMIKTGRNSLTELFRLKDRHGKSLILGPTHEEAIVNHVSNCRPSYRQLPLKLYQISPKFRDEIKPRFGLMRSRDFLMKDLYCFNSCSDSAKLTYDEVNDCYHRIFKKLKLPYCCVHGSAGDIGGSLSHEFHLLADIGEDKLVICQDCGRGKNLEAGNISTTQCDDCQSANVTVSNGIEVGHSFLLGTRYTEPLVCRFVGQDQSLQLLQMSCHGIGLSRLLAAIVEVGSTADAIHWPPLIAPFTVCIIPPKAGSKEELAKNNLEVDLLANEYDVVVDDRTEMTVGKRLKEAKAMGCPLIIVAGKSITDSPPMVEVHTSNSTDLVHLDEMTPFIRTKLKQLVD